MKYKLLIIAIFLFAGCSDVEYTQIVKVHYQDGTTQVFTYQHADSMNCMWLDGNGCLEAPTIVLACGIQTIETNKPNNHDNR